MKYRVYLTLDDGKSEHLIIQHNQKNNAIATLKNNKWVKDEELGIIYNMDKVVSFQIEEIEEK